MPELMGGATPFFVKLGWQVGMFVIVAVFILAIVLAIWFLRRKMVAYTIKVKIWQPRLDGWKVFYRKGAFITDLTTKQEIFKIKGKKQAVKPPILNKLTKGNEAEFLETEIGELIPITTEIIKDEVFVKIPKTDNSGNPIIVKTKVPKVDEEGKPILNEKGEQIFDEVEEQEFEIKRQYMPRRVIDPDVTNDRMFQEMLILESYKTFSIENWLKEHQALVSTFMMILCVTIFSLFIWYVFSHPIVISASISGSNVISGG